MIGGNHIATAPARKIVVLPHQVETVPEKDIFTALLRPFHRADWPVFLVFEAPIPAFRSPLDHAVSDKFLLWERLCFVSSQGTLKCRSASARSTGPPRRNGASQAGCQSGPHWQ
jgi:hypothetical protein